MGRKKDTSYLAAMAGQQARFGFRDSEAYTKAVAKLENLTEGNNPRSDLPADWYPGQKVSTLPVELRQDQLRAAARSASQHEVSLQVSDSAFLNNTSNAEKFMQPLGSEWRLLGDREKIELYRESTFKFGFTLEAPGVTRAVEKKKEDDELAKKASSSSSATAPAAAAAAPLLPNIGKAKMAPAINYSLPYDPALLAGQLGKNVPQNVVTDIPVAQDGQEEEEEEGKNGPPDATINYSLL